MSEKTERSLKGVRFEQLCELRGVSNSDIVKRLKKPTKQTVTNWRLRGVSSTYAIPVADMLRCEPEEISNITLQAAKQPDDAEARRRKTRLELLQELEDRTATMDQERLEEIRQMLALLLKR